MTSTRPQPGRARCPDCGREVDADADLCDCGFPLMFLHPDEPSSAHLKPSRRPLDDDDDTDELPIPVLSQAHAGDLLPPSATWSEPLPAEGIPCPSCQEVNPIARTWCARCGAQLQERVVVVEEPAAPLRRRRRRGWIVAGAGVVLLAAAATGAWLALRGSGTPAAPVRLSLVSAAASATAAPNVAGDRKTVVRYDADHLIDGDPTTAWRVDGDGVGATLVLRLDRERVVTRVGLIPGYAKVDPTDGADRFTQNRTVTQVRWSFDDGAEHLQDIPDPQPRMSYSDLPEPVTTRTVTLEITGSGAARTRPFTAVSEVELLGE